MTRIAIVYHSQKGRTEIIAGDVLNGARSVDGVTADLFSVQDADIAALRHYDAIIFGSPTYMGSVSGAFKNFMDGTSDAWMRHDWKDKIAAAFVTSYAYSGDKLNVLQQLCVFAAQHGMIWVGVGDMPDGPTENNINRHGSFLGAMAQSDTPAGDRRTAYNLGARVATIARRFVQTR